MQSHSAAHPELQPRQRLEKPGAIIEYANARRPLTVSLSVALDEIRAEALMWDADGSQNRHVHKVQRAGRVWMRLVLIRKGAQSVMMTINSRHFLSPIHFLSHTLAEDVNVMSSQVVL